MKPIKLFWSRGSGRNNPGKQNFGDYLSAGIVEMVSGRNVVWSSAQKAEMIAIGSVLVREKKAKILGFPRRLHIWGTGSGSPNDTFSDRHYYHAVRGAHCQAQIKGLRSQPALGDPGLLAARYVQGRDKKSIRVGVIPHLSHQNDPQINAILQRIPGSRIIDVFSPVKQVLEEISACEFVLSSSLHGLIIADSYGVPNRWLTLEDDESWKFKFNDYYSSFGLHMKPLLARQITTTPNWSIEQTLEGYHRPGLAALQEGLVKAFPDL